MRYTHHRGLTRVSAWVRLKYAAVNLKKLGFFDRLSIHPPSGWMLIHSWAHGHGRESLLLQEEITNDHAFLVSFLFTINAASAAAEWWYTPYP